MILEQRAVRLPSCSPQQDLLVVVVKLLLICCDDVDVLRGQSVDSDCVAVQDPARPSRPLSVLTCHTPISLNTTTQVRRELLHRSTNSKHSPGHLQHSRDSPGLYCEGLQRNISSRPPPPPPPWKQKIRLTTVCPWSPHPNIHQKLFIQINKEILSSSLLIVNIVRNCFWM